MDVRDDERLPQHLDHRDRGADGGLEPKLDAAGSGCLEELRPAPRDQLLVRGDDRPAAAEKLEDVRAGRLDAAHHLGDDRDLPVVAKRGEVVCEHPGLGREGALLARSRTSARVTRSR